MKYLFLIGLIALTFVVISRNSATQQSTDSSSSNTDTNSVQYKTIAVKNGFEIREYPSLAVASTELNSRSYSENSNSGFRKIASYIFGGNSSNQQISMTSPVQMDMGENPSMSFFMPENLNIDDLPVPNRKDVYVHIQPSKIVAVIQFSGWASDTVLEEQFNKLKVKLKKEGIEFEDSYSYLGYNPPYKLINRKNEVIIPLSNFKEPNI